jgi:alpha-beta hydrolase superfamily lysophospholipase
MSGGPSRFAPDPLPGFEQLTLPLASEDDGELVATLVRERRVRAEPDPAPAGVTALYLHGYSDYFFQAHVAKAFAAAGVEHYALDLRRYGRSLRPGNAPNQASRISDYFAELDAAVALLTELHRAPIVLVGHSTGGLIAAHYCRYGALRPSVVGLVLNSPFLDFRATRLERAELAVVERLGRVAPRAPLPISLEPIYGRTIHRSQAGEWDYALDMKPLSGFPLLAGWFTMIRAAQREVEAGLSLTLPVLLLHSARSRRPGAEPTAADFLADTVLDVTSMTRLGPRLGSRVTLRAVEGGLHDLTLSRQVARDEALAAMTRFAVELGA